MGLEIHPAGIEEDALADQRDIGGAAARARRPVPQVRDAGPGLIVPCAHGEEGIGAGAPQGALVPPAQRQADGRRARRGDRPPVALRVQHVRRQRGQPARKIRAPGGRRGVACIDAFLARAVRPGAGAARGARRLRKLGSAKAWASDAASSASSASRRMAGAARGGERDHPAVRVRRAPSSMRPASARRSKALASRPEVAQHGERVAAVVRGLWCARCRRAAARWPSSCRQRALSGGARRRPRRPDAAR